MCTDSYPSVIHYSLQKNSSLLDFNQILDLQNIVSKHKAGKKKKHKAGSGINYNTLQDSGYNVK
ncbi:hypothetical protein BB561_003086 [Smittium simulii]|uniref:Uncharacterized protein n=1 Tax=Smittium simulii TaxID=133385 RepID=A0A2T9YMW6_9FUNG|nr:hypothetical protein BB561_003086 [Smittium simulii]